MIDNYISVFHKEQNDKLYRIYVTDALKTITGNTATHEGSMIITKRFIDILDRTPEVTEEEIQEKSEEVVANLMDKLRKV